MMSTSAPTSRTSTTTKDDGKGSISKLLLPKKPYTEYTIFFRLEQSRIVQTTGGAINKEVLAAHDPNHYDPLEFPRPSKYENIIMYPYWYSSSHAAAIEKKRKHRKLKGRLDFKTLSKTISNAWRHADQEVVQYCRKLAKAENEKYNIIVENINRQEKVHKVQLQTEATSPPQLLKSTTSTPQPVNSSSSTQDEILLKKIFQMQQHTNDALGKMRQFHQLQTQAFLPNNTSSDTAAFGSTFSVASNQGSKRKYVRRASAPPEFMQNNNMLPFEMGSNSSMIDTTSRNTSIGSMGKELGMSGFLNLNSVNMNVVSTDSSMTSVVTKSDVFFGEDNCSPPKYIKTTQRRRRATVQAPYCPDNNMSSTSSLLLPSHELQAMQEAFKNDDSKIISSLDNTDEPLSFKPRRRASVASFAPAQEELRKSFQEELNKNSSESYCCVPNWAKKDADKLLDLLNMPED